MCIQQCKPENMLFISPPSLRPEVSLQMCLYTPTTLHTHLSEVDPVVVVVVERALQVSCELGLVDVFQQGFQRR